MSLTEAPDPHDLLSAARDLVRIDDEQTVGLWPRAAALLCRQALERSMDRLFERTAPGLQHATGRCKLLCLGELLNDRDLGGRVALTWNVLSDACHHRVYELPPTAAELQPALHTVWELADSVDRVLARLR